MDDTSQENDLNWRIKLNKMECEFNKKRRHFISNVSRYNRQSIYGNYVTELQLSSELRELYALRQDLIKFSKDHYPDTTKAPYKLQVFPFFNKKI